MPDWRWRQLLGLAFGSMLCWASNLPRLHLTVAIISPAASDAVVVLATRLFGHPSLNAIIHQLTLQIHATHLLSWPTEGTLRVVAPLLYITSVSVLWYLWPRMAAGPRPSLPEEPGARAMGIYG
jgi:hypothetical protein